MKNSFHELFSFLPWNSINLILYYSILLKKTIPLKLILILLSFSLFGCSAKNNLPSVADLIGTWHAHNNFVITFKSNNKFDITFINKENNKIFNGFYFVDNLNFLQTITLKKINKFEGSLHSIFKFIDLNTIKISKFSKHLKTRPITFEKNNYFIIKRNIIP